MNFKLILILLIVTLAGFLSISFDKIRVLERKISAIESVSVYTSETLITKT
jgi:hypothetical protein